MAALSTKSPASIDPGFINPALASRNRRTGFTPARLPVVDGAVDLKLKRCARCGEQYPMTPEYWYLNRSASDGLHSYCRACRREYQSDYWTLNYSRDGQLRRKNMLKPVDYVVLHSEEGGTLSVIYSGGGLAVGRIHAVVEGDLPEEYSGLKKLYEIATTETNFQRLLAYNAENRPELASSGANS